MFVAPLVGAIPAAATGPALILVGCMMATVLADIRWDDMEIAVPAFLTIMTIPLTFSIATGLAFGFSAYTAMKVFRGKFRDVNWLVYALTAVFLFRFLYLAKG
jgi:AGZA family xanthine/uracil permease-like MFS transporter